MQRDLTLYPPKDDPVCLYGVDGNDVTVPRAYAHLIPAQCWSPISLGRPWGYVPDAVKLRPYQETPVDTMERHLQEHGGGVLEAPCGTGKTVCALEIMRFLGRSTLVLVHKEFLMNQWRERIKEFLPGIKVGVWQRDQMDSGLDYDVVLGMVQSVVSPSREYPPALFNSFGMVVTDEVHRFAAPLWQTAITKFPAKYRLGLTATPKRRDGMEYIFYYHIGNIASQIAHTNRIPTIYKLTLPTQLNRRDYIFPWNGDINTAKLVTLLASSNPRTAYIMARLHEALERGRKVMVLSERREHVEYMLKTFQDDSRFSEFTGSKYMGQMKQVALTEAEGADAIFGTYQMAAEGLDIPDIDTLLMATPKTGVIQAVGRILRDYPDKKQPVVLDFVDDNIDICRAYWGSRRKKYLSHRYPVVG